MKLLALDTSTPRESIALLSDKELVGEVRLLSPEGHSARLLRSIRFLLDSAGWREAELGLIAVGIGPGSFTGIRIGIATALGLSQTLRIPFAGVSCLEAVASMLVRVEGSLGVIMDAHRDQVYFQEFAGDGHRITRAGKPVLANPAELRPRFQNRRFLLVGDGAARYLSQLRGRKTKNPILVETDLFVAPAIGRIALERRRTWRTGDGLKCDPLYIRPPDARKPKGPGN